ncbi:mucin-5AC isoform X2 [Topomyia yanbarensis]|uniref:mucin-5AC isoform X2 n=1 Tax=Topomyia yanbarensis TaxID=2498891 RepID=UPI00273BCF93|nr:mucin-5AC isoform X2 [Topomyia yanbarensis]
MGHFQCKSLAYMCILLLNVGLLLQQSSAQQSNFFFGQPQSGRFVPSFENPRNGFFPSSIQRNQPPDSYQEQTLFVGNSNSNRQPASRGVATGSADRGAAADPNGVTPPSYFQFTYTTPRSPDIFEISPRPFSVTPQPNSGFQYSRGSLRNEYFGGGIPSSNRNFPSSSSSSSGISSSGSSHSYRQTQRKSPFSSSATGTSLTNVEPLSTEGPQRPVAATETGGRRDQPLSYISNRARPFGNEDAQPSRGLLGSTAAQQRQQQSQNSSQRQPPSAVRNGFRPKAEDQSSQQQNETNNGSAGSGVGSSSNRYSKTTVKPNRYRSTTTLEPVTAKSTTVESVVLRNRFSGRSPAPNPFRQAFDSKRVTTPTSVTTSRGTFINSIKSKTSTSTPTTTTTTTKAAPSSRFIHLPARPVIPSINITHNGSAKSAEVIYDYDDYEEDSKDGNDFTDEQQEIKDFKPTSQKNNSISVGKDENKPVSSTTIGAPTSTSGKEYENEERGGSLNNINENEYYDVVSEGDGQRNAEKIEDHTVILTDNFYLPNSGSEEVIDEEFGEEQTEEHEEPKKEVPSVVPVQEDKKEVEPVYDDDYVYEDEEPVVSTTAPADVKPSAPPVKEEQIDDFDTLIYSEEDAVEESPVNHSSEKTEPATTRATTTEATSTATSPAPTSTTESASQEISSTTERTLNSSVEVELTSNATTESWVVVASVQTSRSVSGARFLPFAQVEQEEKKQSLSELDSKNSNENDEPEITTANSQEIDRTTVAPQEPVIAVTDDSEVPTTEKTLSHLSLSTESINDKLDRVQSELSVGVLTGKLPVLKEMPADDSKNPSSLPSVVIRKFQPRVTTTKKPRPVFTTSQRPTTSTENLAKKINFEAIAVDDISFLLPPDYKQKNAYKVKKFGVSTTTHEPLAAAKDVLNEEPLRPDFGYRFRPANISRSYKSNAPIQELSSLLPKDYRSNRTEDELKTTNNLKELISRVRVGEKPNVTLDVLKKAQPVDISSFLPPGYKPPAESGSSTKAPKASVIEDDVSKLLPPGYKNFKTTKKPTTTTSSPPAIEDDVSKFLPPGYKPPKGELIINDNISKFLPPGYKPPKTEVSTKASIVFSDDISKFLPPGYKASSDDKKPEPEVIDPSTLLNQIKFKDVSALLPAGFNESKSEPSPSNTSENNNFKVVFPSRPGIKKPGSGRSTTAKPLHAEGPAVPDILIRKGPPTRATTEFTGWPTPSTTPLSIEKLLERQKQQELLEKLLVASSTTTTTSTTTTSTTTTPRPTEPGLCQSECDLAGTIRIVDGVNWVPELLDHNTAEWKQLAKEVEAQLNEVYSNAQNLSKWYKKVRIDSFSKGSVLVDYFVELADLTQDVNTLQIKKLFHEALKPAPVVTTTAEPSTDLDEDGDGEQEDHPKKVKENLQSPVPHVKEVFLLGRFKVDPVSTDFTVIPKPILPTVTLEEEDLLLPQWAIAVIVIGLASLLFVVIFGVSVLINRQKAAKKKAPTPLTADMLNELNKNHMGGIDNFGSEDLYNLDDTWDDHTHDVKPKRFSNSMHGSSASNIYDSWRSQRHPDNYYYDDYGLKGSHYPPSSHHHHRLADAAFMMHEPPPPVMALYPPYHHAPAPPSGHYNTNSRRYYRDYDPNF